MAKRKNKRRSRPKAIVDRLHRPRGQRPHPAGVVERGDDRQDRRAAGSDAASLEDAWRRRTEMLFERLVVGWEIAGLPLDDQKMLLGRYRMADAETQHWVRQTIADHLERYIPELAEQNGEGPVVRRRAQDRRRLSIPLAEIELRASRSSGPGGQHANVTASRVEAVFDVERSRGARRGAAGAAAGAGGADGDRHRPGCPRPVTQSGAGAAAAGGEDRGGAAGAAAAARDAPDPRLAAAPARSEAAHRRAQARPPTALGSGIAMSSSADRGLNG